MKKLSKILLALVLSSMVLVGCASKPAEPAAEGKTEEKTEQKVVKIGLVTDTGGVDDKSYATLFATMQESSNNNPMIQPMLKTKGLDTTEFTALTLNSSLKPENKRYQPIKSTVVDSMRQEYQQLTSAPDTPAG